MIEPVEGWQIIYRHIRRIGAWATRVFFSNGGPIMGGGGMEEGFPEGSGEGRGDGVGRPPARLEGRTFGQFRCRKIFANFAHWNCPPAPPFFRHKLTAGDLVQDVF